MSRRRARPKQSAGLNTELFKALSDPFRGRIMIVLTERQASAKELSDLLGEPLGNTSYHLRELRKADLVELVGTESHRGGVKRIYKASARPVLDQRAWEQVPQVIRELNTVWVGQLIIGDMAEAIREGTFDKRTERTQVRLPMVADEEGWLEIEALATRFLEGALDVQAKSAQRMAESQEEGSNVALSLMAFEMPAGERTRNVKDPSPVRQSLP